MSITVTTEQMYGLLVKIEQRLISMSASLENLDERVADHEARLRTIESKEDLARRTLVIEGKVDELQKRVWAIPSASALIALIALVITLAK